MGRFDDLDNNQLFDSIIEDVGSFGKFQKRTLGLSLIVSAVAAFNHLSVIYYLFTPEFSCDHPKVRIVIFTAGHRDKRQGVGCLWPGYRY